MARLSPLLTAAALGAVLIGSSVSAAVASPLSASNTSAIEPAEQATTLGDFVVISGRPGDLLQVPLRVQDGARLQPTGVTFDNGEVRFGGAPLAASSWTRVDATVPEAPVVSVQIPADQLPGDYAAAVRAVGDEASAIGVLIRVEGNRSTALSLDTQEYELHGAGAWPLTTSQQSLSYRVRNDGDTVIAGEFSIGVATLFSTFVPFGESRHVMLFPGEEIVGTARGTALPTALLTAEARVAVEYAHAGGGAATYAERAAGETALVVPWLALSAGAATIVVATALAMLLRRRARGRSARP